MINPLLGHADELSAPLLPNADFARLGAEVNSDIPENTFWYSPTEDDFNATD